MSYIEFREIDKYYGSNHVLKGIDLTIEKGQFVTLLGPSGCGKSTLLRCLAGLEPIGGGRIFLDGEDITEREPKDRNIGMVFQQYSLFPNMNVEENIAFSLKLKKMDPQKMKEKVAAVIQMVELTGKEKQYPANLSGGQQQRVALARSIVMEPKVLLLDEPLSAVDAKLRKSLQVSIRQIVKRLGLTAIFVTHDQDEAMIMSDVIHLFHEGRIEQSGDPVSVYTRPASSFAAGFIGNYNLLKEEEFRRAAGDGEIRDGRHGDGKFGGRKAGEEKSGCGETGCRSSVKGETGCGSSADGSFGDNEKIGTKNECPGTEREVAIRPETFAISAKPLDNGEEYQMEGIVEDSVPRGNVLRYRVNVNGVRLHVDVLFRSKVLFENGEKVYLSVAKRNCIRL